MDKKIVLNGHACVSFYTKSGKVITCDPWISDDPVYAYTEWRMPISSSKFRNKILSETDYLYISHSHEDHFHIPSLKLFRKDINIIIPSFDWVDFKRKFYIKEALYKLGFSNIIEMRSWDELIIDGSKLILIPAAKSRMHDWENSGIIFMEDDFCALNLNDNIPDLELINDIKDNLDGKNLDVALIQAGGVSNYPSCFIMSKIEFEKAIKQKKSDYSRQLMVCENLNPSISIPIAGDFAWIMPTQIELNKYARESPIPLINFLRENGFHGYAYCPQNFISKEGNNLEFHYEENLHLNYEKLIKDTRKYYKKKQIHLKSFILMNIFPYLC